MKHILALSIFFIAVLSIGCTKEEEPEIVSSSFDTTYTAPIIISDTPNISFESILPINAVQYEDSIVIRFSYIDGDGDLGENFTESKNLFVTDSRNNIVYEYRIPQLSPNTSDNIAIQGQFEVIINTITLMNQDNPSESLTYGIYVIDRAGNQSNTIQTSSITVNAP